MRIPRPRPSLRSWLRLPRRTARLRLAVLYGGVFLACGAAVLALTYLLDGHATPLVPLHQPPKVSGPPKVPLDPLAAAQQARVRSLKMDLFAQIASDRHQLLIQSGIALAVVTVAAVAIGWLLAGRVLRPLSTITAAARRISASSLHERLDLPGPDDELKLLGDTLDRLLARLEAAFDAQRRFAANASHELRTPLTRERALLEVTRADPAATAGTWRAVSQDLLAFIAEQDRLIEALLTLASSEAGPGEREPTDLAAITSAALAAVGPAISDLGLHVHARIQPATLQGDPVLVGQLVTNLIDNAVRHNIPGGQLQVATAAGRGSAVLSVASSGPFIPAADVDRLFQPFQRLGPRPARRDGGHGLGLAIVQAIATAHDATITAQPRPGGGLAIDITFPPPAAARPPQTRQPVTARPALA
jgi:signal transduction histidine kinase